MEEVIVGGMPVVGSIVLTVAVLRRALSLDGSWAPLLSLVVSIVFSLAIYQPLTLDAGLDAFVASIGWSAVSVGGHSSVKHLMEVLDERRTN